MSLRELARALRGDVAGPNRVLCPGPGHSLKDRSLCVSVQGDGVLVHSFAGNDWRECRDHVNALIGTPRPVRPELIRSRDTKTAALAIWDQCRDARGTVVENYLASRGLELDGAADIRVHPNLRYESGETPAMVALLRNVQTDAPCGIHRTFLTRDAKKIDRRMLGCAKGAAIQLDPGEGVTHGLAIAEGVESALAARTSFRPVWAVGSAGGIASLPVLGGVDCLTIFADADAAGQAAARTCARRWQDCGREVFVRTPPAGDANDLLREDRE